MEKYNLNSIKKYIGKFGKNTTIYFFVCLFILIFLLCIISKEPNPVVAQTMGGSYDQAVITERRWETLRDTVEYAIKNPRIDDAHPNISLALNPEKKEHQDEKKSELRFKPDNIIEENNKLDEIMDYAKAQKVQNETLQIEEDTFEKLAELEKMIKNKETDYKLLYWTFDDGPYAKTDKFLRRLDKYHIQATFFTTSINGKRCFDNRNKKTAPFYKKYLKYGHTIGNHTYTHGLGRGLYDSKRNFVKAVRKQEDHVYNLTGYRTKIYRFPGGSLTAGNLKKPIIKALRKEGYVWVDWSAQTGDGGALKSSKRAYHNFKVSMGEPIEVLLCHDYAEKTYKIMPKIIKYSRKHHYIFAPLFPESVALNR